MKITLVLFTLCVVWLNEFSGIVAQIGPGITCTTDADCNEYTGVYCGYYSHCLKCVCKDSLPVYDSSTKTCYASRKIGESCTIADQCPDKGSSVGGLCSSNVCACDSGYTANSDKTTCHRPYMGEDCDINFGCNVPSLSTCTNGKCECKAAYRPTSTGCRKPYFGETCTTNIGCVDSTTMSCTDNKCACKSAYPQSGQLACTKSKVDQSCSLATDCLATITNADCTDNKCACPDTSNGPSSDKTSCNKQILGEKCDDASQCIASLMSCASAKCACGEGYVTEGTTVCRLPLFDEACTTTVNCDASEGTNVKLECDGTNKCICADGYTQTTAGEKCVKLNIGDTCVTTDTVSKCGSGAQCKAGTTTVCTCLDDYTENSNGYDCDPPVLGSKCTDGESSCSGTDVQAACATDKCICEGSRQPDESNSGSCRVSKLGEQCEIAENDCDKSITSVRCTDNVCACPSELNEENGDCVTAKYDEACGGSVTKTCGTNLECSSTTNKCVCTTGNTYDTAISTCRNDDAQVAVAVGGTCTDLSSISSLDWTSTPAYLRCDPSASKNLTCMQCNNAGTYMCMTEIEDAAVSIHASMATIVALLFVALFNRM